MIQFRNSSCLNQLGIHERVKVGIKTDPTISESLESVLHRGRYFEVKSDDYEWGEKPPTSLSEAVRNMIPHEPRRRHRPDFGRPDFGRPCPVLEPW